MNLKSSSIKSLLVSLVKTPETVIHAIVKNTALPLRIKQSGLPQSKALSDFKLYYEDMPFRKVLKGAINGSRKKRSEIRESRRKSDTKKAKDTSRKKQKSSLRVRATGGG